jgi:hypothetical protein
MMFLTEGGAACFETRSKRDANLAELSMTTYDLQQDLHEVIQSTYNDQRAYRKGRDDSYCRVHINNIRYRASYIQGQVITILFMGDRDIRTGN